MLPSRRLIASCLVLMAASLLISLLGLAQGPVPLTIDQVFSALFGDAPRNVAMVVNEWRLPRVLMALLIGAALGVSGAIFQSLTRNPLGSPDVMGFNTGAWSGVLVAMVLFGQNLTAIALAAMAGGGVDLAGGLAAGLAQRDRDLPPDHYRHRRARHAGGIQHLAAAAPRWRPPFLRARNGTPDRLTA